MLRIVLAMLALSDALTVARAVDEPPVVRRAATFTNPIAPGADPWVIRHGGFYYWCSSEHDLGVVVYRSKRLIFSPMRLRVARSFSKASA